MQVFARLPTGKHKPLAQFSLLTLLSSTVKKIYFGGSHDNGYAPSIFAIQNEGYLGKIVLLQSYTKLGAEIKALDLPCLNNNGIFLKKKLPKKLSKKAPLVLGTTRTATPEVGMDGDTEAGAVSLPPQSPNKNNIKANIEKLKVGTSFSGIRKHQPSSSRPVCAKPLPFALPITIDIS
jgi:hypothetical protein